MAALALVLFLPWFAILAWAYWAFPRSLPRTGARRAFDAGALLLALAASALAMYRAYHGDYGAAGAIWKQVMASLMAYALFLAVLTAAFAVRAWIFAGRSR